MKRAEDRSASAQRALEEAEESLAVVVRRLREKDADGDGERAGFIAAQLGGVFLYGVAAVCEALGDVAAAIRERPA